jgi:glycosyltransferase involved in cell wall biosynthesis
VSISIESSTKGGLNGEILFFVPEWPALDSPILHAQVLSVATFLSREGFYCRFAGAETSPSRAQKAATLIQKEYGIQAYVEHALPQKAGAYTMLWACQKVYRHMRSKLSNIVITHVYARSFTGSMWARRLARQLKATSVFDVRAIVSHEQLLEGKSFAKAWVSSCLELRESRQADRLSTVSENLRAYLRQQTGRQDITVIPSCINEDTFHFSPASREEIRRAFGLKDDDVLFCYSGGTSAWQRIDDIMLLLKDVCVRDDRCHALFLTANYDEMIYRLATAQFPAARAWVRSCSHRDVHKYLSSADVGLIMRHDISVNNVASPVKVGEYLACGLPVILTKGIGDYSRMLPAAGVGLLLDESSDTINQVLNFIRQPQFSAQRNMAMRFSKSKLTMSANLEQYRLLYGAR